MLEPGTSDLQLLDRFILSVTEFVIRLSGKMKTALKAIRLLGAATLALFCVALLLISFSAEDSPFSEESRLVLTGNHGINLSANATLEDRAFGWWRKIQRKIRKPLPTTSSFPATDGTNPCLIGGLLNQCARVSGLRYEIDSHVAAGTVQFGHTNTLNGEQWVRAFTDALQTAQPEWIDSQTKKGRKENLVVLTNDVGTIFVLSKEMADEFQRRKTE